MPSMTEMVGGSGDLGSAILFSFWTVSLSVCSGEGISVWIVSADADSAESTPGGSSVSTSTVKGTSASSSAENDTLCFFDGEAGIALGVILSRFWKNSGMIFTKFKFFMVCNPKIRSTSDSGAIRTGRLKVCFKSSLLNDATISSTFVDSTHRLFKPEHIHMGESEFRKWVLRWRPRRTLPFMTSPT